MITRLFAACILTFGLTSVARAQDRCQDLQIDQLIEPRTANYASFGGDSVDEVFSLRVSRGSGAQRCRAFLTFTADPPRGGERFMAGPDGGQLRYELLDQAGALIGDGTRNRDRVNFRFERDETEREFLIRLSMPAGQTVPAGTYSDRIIARLFDRRGGGRLADERGLTLRAAVASRAEVNLARQPGLSFSAGRSYDVVDFGELETGESRAILVRVRSNAAYRISLESENLGQLMRRGGSGAAGDQIGYSARLDGDGLDLTAPIIALRNPLAPGASEELVFDVVIGDVSQARAGSYSDLITVTVEPVR